MSQLQKTVARTFYTIASLAGLLFISAIAVVVGLAPYIKVLVQQIMPVVEEACGCGAYLPFSTNPFVALLLLFTFALAFAALAFLVIRIGIVSFRTHQFKKRLRQAVQSVTYFRGIPIYAVDLQQPLAVSIGWRKPAIYVSQGLQDTLSGFELWAVLRHEIYHAQQSHPRQRLMLTIIRPLVPFSSKLMNYFQAVQELSADEYVNNDEALRTALIKIVEGQSTEFRRATSHVGATFFSVTDARINRLLGRSFPRPSAIPVLIGVLTVVLASTLSYQALAAGSQDPALASCLQQQQMCEEIMSVPLMTMPK